MEFPSAIEWGREQGRCWVCGGILVWILEGRGADEVERVCHVIENLGGNREVPSYRCEC